MQQERERERQREREGKRKTLLTRLETLHQLGPKSPDKEQWVAWAVKESTTVHLLSLLQEDSMQLVGICPIPRKLGYCFQVTKIGLVNMWFFDAVSRKHLVKTTETVAP